MSGGRISLCVIARDEERWLPGCLASARGAADEIVVVDTGSTDRTAALAREAGAKVVPFAWRDDFAAARNAALPHATGDWILVLDADERLAPGAAERIRAAVAAASFDVGLLRLHHASRADARPDEIVSGAARAAAPTLLPRLLRHAGGLAWRGVIHESVLEWAVARGTRLARVDADIAHLGGAPAERERLGKRERNLALLREACRREPDDATAYGYLALELLEAGDAEGAWRVAEAGWKHVAAQPPHRSIQRLAVARALAALRRGDLAAVLDTVEHAEARSGPHPDFAWLRGAALENRALAAREAPSRTAVAREAVAAYAAALELSGRPWLDRLVEDVQQPSRWIRLGSAALLAGDSARAREAFDRMLEEAPGTIEARVGRAEAALASGDAAGALAQVEPLLGDVPDGWLLAALAARALGAAADAELLAAQARARAARGFLAPHRRWLLGSFDPVRAGPVEAREALAAPAHRVTAAGDRWAVTVVSPPDYLHSEAFREVAEALCHGLRRLGRDAILTRDPRLAGRRHLVLGANLAAAARIPLSPGAILYNLEQIQEGSPWLTPQLLALYRRHEVWDYSPTNAAALERLGVARPRVVPVGWVPELARIAPAPVEDVDVLFYGSRNERRNRVLAALQAHGARVEAPFGLYGAARDALIARSRLVLNVHYYEAKVFEIVRVSYLLGNGRAVVSERGCDPAEEAPFEDGIAFAPYERLVETCLALLRDDPRRRRVAEAGRVAMTARRQEDALRPVIEEAEGA